jgi:hypothetical protein
MTQEEIKQKMQEHVAANQEKIQEFKEKVEQKQSENK